MTDISGYCQSRRLFFIYNTPPTRYNPTSPYIGTDYTNTKNGLDMRRKAEILKYNTYSQQGTITKKKRWSQIINTNIRSTASVGSVAPDCESDDSIPTLSSACDVPGPIIVLYNDPNVPLYNYKKNTDAYSLLDKLQNEDEYQLSGIATNLEYVTNVRNFLCILKILNNIELNRTVFILIIPVTIQIDYTSSELSGYVDLSFNIPNLNISYGAQVLQETDFNSNMFDIEGKLINLSGQNRIILPAGTTQTQKHYYFHISNIDLFTSNGYAYSLYLTNTNSLYTQTSSNVVNPTVKVFLNSDTNPIKMKINTTS